MEFCGINGQTDMPYMSFKTDVFGRLIPHPTFLGFFLFPLSRPVRDTLRMTLSFERFG